MSAAGQRVKVGQALGTHVSALGTKGRFFRLAPTFQPPCPLSARNPCPSEFDEVTE